MISPSRALLLWAARLYPRAWRERYGEEFAAMIEDLPAGRARWTTVGDILRGALFMRVRRGVMGMAVMGGLAGLLIAVGIGLAIPDRYVTGALVRVGADVGDEALTAVVERTLEREELERVAGKYGMYGRRADVAERMQEDVYVSWMHPGKDGSRGLRIGFRHSVPETARRVAGELTAAMIRGQAGLTLVDAPALPRSPYGPNRTTIALLGMGAGTMAGLVAGYLRRKVQRL